MKKARKLASIVLTILLTLTIILPVNAFAAVVGYVVEEEDGTLVQYSYKELIDAYVAGGALYERYSKGEVVAFVDDEGGYTDFGKFIDMMIAGDFTPAELKELLADPDAENKWSGDEIVIIDKDGEPTGETITVGPDGQIDPGTPQGQTVAQAKAAAEQALTFITKDNDVEADDIMDAVTGVITNPAITASWSVAFNKTPAQLGQEGLISGEIELTDGTDTETIEIDWPITALVQTVAQAKAAAEIALGQIVPSNATTAEGIMTAVTGVITNPAITASWTTPFAKVDAVVGTAGSITGVITLTDGTDTETITITWTIPALVATQTLAEAKAAIEGVLADITANNATTQEYIMGMVNAAISDNITATPDTFVIDEAEPEVAGSITGVITISDGTDTDTVDVNLTIDALPPVDVPEKVVVEVVTEGVAAVPGGTPGVWTLTISEGFAEGEEIVINGITFTCRTVPMTDFDFDITGDEDDQATTLAAKLDISTISDGFEIAGDTDGDNGSGVITFTEKVSGATSGVTAYTTAGTGRISMLEQTEDSVGALTDIYGSWTLQITGLFLAGDEITIDGVTYTHSTTSGFGATKDINAQATQLKKLLDNHPTLSTVFNFTVATDKITARQKVAGVGTMPEIEVTQKPPTLAAGAGAASDTSSAYAAGTPAEWTLAFTTTSAYEGILFTLIAPDATEIVFWYGADATSVEYDYAYESGTNETAAKLSAALESDLQTALDAIGEGYTVSDSSGTITIAEDAPLSNPKPNIVTTNGADVLYSDGTTPVADTHATWTVTIDTAFSAGDLIVFKINAGDKATVICETTPGFSVGTAAQQAEQLATILSDDTNFDGYVITTSGAAITFTEVTANTSSVAVTSAVTRASDSGDGGTADVINKYSTGGTGQSATAGASYGAWEFEITTAFKVGDKITINGTEFECVAAGAAAGAAEFNEGLRSAQATQLVAKATADGTANTAWTYAANGAVITITEKVAGTAADPVVAVSTGTARIAFELDTPPAGPVVGVPGVWTITFNSLLEDGDYITFPVGIADTRVYTFGSTFDGDTIDEQIANFKALLDAVNDITTNYTITLEDNVLTFTELVAGTPGTAPEVTFTPAA